jgi:hypothetical protein
MVCTAFYLGLLEQAFARFWHREFGNSSNYSTFFLIIKA